MLPEEYDYYKAGLPVPPDVLVMRKSLPLEQPQPVGEEPHFARVEVILVPDITLE